MPNSSSMAAASVTVATESHAVTEDALACVTLAPSSSGNTAWKQRINRCCESDTGALHLMKIYLMEQGRARAVELFSPCNLAAWGYFGEKALHRTVPFGVFKTKSYRLPT